MHSREKRQHRQSQMPACLGEDMLRQGVPISRTFRDDLGKACDIGFVESGAVQEVQHSRPFLEFEMREHGFVQDIHVPMARLAM
eukprot:CAMPEP_0175972744 /NCGR_PEP_ID=MMETSP0108-20121206/42401_1 /TAXON_ID=195067 ORGANISM="Goniomonas pacifica, Strain CCMP1869" /NCGR_SAMPLE_ID=MMETSP0108 /ASSEMBLY_ACC=CAM_ASM_000204 /LENGTH=83 /DNA_ID=CAMNT_0017302099 /DNA_START=218 /DNA_END=469 /DNA_ORIENTATION=+